MHVIVEHFVELGPLHCPTGQNWHEPGTLLLSIAWYRPASHATHDSCGPVEPRRIGHIEVSSGSGKGASLEAL
jgi:hypothetical protein